MFELEREPLGYEAINLTITLAGFSLNNLIK
jgi:hypothetical protein